MDCPIIICMRVRLPPLALADCVSFISIRSLHNKVDEIGSVLRTSSGQIARFMEVAPPPDAPPLLRFRFALALVCDSMWARSLMIFVVIANLIVIGIEIEADHVRDPVLETLEHMFYWLFLAESLSKILAYGPPLWATDPWNMLDAVILICMSIDYFVHVSSSQALDEETLMTPLRLLRITRLVKLIGLCAPLHKMMAAFYNGMSQVGWLVALILLLLYAFALVCTTLFAPLDDGRTQAAFYEVLRCFLVF